jgi:hypothetical protein
MKRRRVQPIARKSAVVQKQPRIQPGRALRALTEQLEALQQLKGRRYDEADTEETEWMHLTRSLIEAAFGESSPSMDEFLAATHAGSHFVRGSEPIPRPQLQQNNFQARLAQFEALLKALINTLRLQLPEEEIKGVYEPGDQYGFYRDLSSLIATTANDIFIVDAYPDGAIFKLYIDEVPSSARVRILSLPDKISEKFKAIAKMCAQTRHIELRSSDRIHDRTVFVDQRGWMIGQSIKDAGRRAPTNMIELAEPVLSATREIYESIWTAATGIIP